MRSFASPGPSLLLHPRKLTGIKLDRFQQACALQHMILSFRISENTPM
jgi:hypothetical protein